MSTQEPLLGSAWLLSQSPGAPNASPSEAAAAGPSGATHTRITPTVCDNYSHFKRLLDQSRRQSDDAISTRLNRAAALAGTVVSGRGSAREMGTQECDNVWRDITARWTERGDALRYCDRALGHTARTGEIASTDSTRVASSSLSSSSTLATGRDRTRDEEIAPVRGLSADWKEQGRGVATEAELKVSRRTRELPFDPFFPRQAAELTLRTLVRFFLFTYAPVGTLFRPTPLPVPLQRSRLLTELSIEEIIRARTLALFSSRCPSHPQTNPPVPALPELGGMETEEERTRRRGRDERGRVRWN